MKFIYVFCFLISLPSLSQHAERTAPLPRIEHLTYLCSLLDKGYQWTQKYIVMNASNNEKIFEIYGIRLHNNARDHRLFPTQSNLGYLNPSDARFIHGFLKFLSIIEKPPVQRTDMEKKVIARHRSDFDELFLHVLSKQGWLRYQKEPDKFIEELARYTLIRTVIGVM